jgi:tripartite-type tricarboxylate transporter receptor subunit TctC
MHSIFTRALAAAVLAFGAFAAGAQEWPTQPVKIIVPFPPGGTTDQIARHAQGPLTQILGQPVIVENHGGASGSIGAAQVAKAAPDGYTWLLVFDTHGVNQSLIPNLPYDTLTDLAPVTLVGVSPMLITAHPSTPYKSFKEVLDQARRDKGSVAFGTIGSGSLAHLAMTLIQNKTGAVMTHVPYKGGGPLVQDAVAGHVPIAIGSAALMSPSVKAGRLRALAVTSSQRFAAIPDVPTIAEQGVPEFASDSWWGLNAPARTPPAIIAKMRKAFSDALRTPAVEEKLTQQGVVLRLTTPEEYQRFLEHEVGQWAQVVKANKISAQ